MRCRQFHSTITVLQYIASSQLPVWVLIIEENKTRHVYETFLFGFKWVLLNNFTQKYRQGLQGHSCSLRKLHLFIFYSINHNKFHLTSGCLRNNETGLVWRQSSTGGSLYGDLVTAGNAQTQSPTCDTTKVVHFSLSSGHVNLRQTIVGDHAIAFLLIHRLMNKV